MARENVREGVFAINKPMGMSSAQVIRDCQTYFNPSDFFRPLIQHEADMRARESNSAYRRRSRAKRDMRVKMGHGGTLDPLATGILILGIGHGTKELNKFLSCTKTYETVVLFGASTDTYDRVGRVLSRRAYDHITRDKVEAALDAFRGTFRQTPPLYSALKMNGKPLYEYAREGLSIPREIETREVDVSALELVEWYEPGTHNHRWPVEEAGVAEQNLAEKVWRMERDQALNGPKKRTPEEEQSDREALAAHEDFKRRAEAKQDELVFDKPAKRRRGPGGAHITDGPGHRRRPSEDQLLMSGALGDLPSSPYHDNGKAGRAAKVTAEEVEETAPADAAAVPAKKSKRDEKMMVPGRRGANLIPPPPEPSTPPPWEGKGPPAARIRMTVSSGFYVRSFCHDLGEKVGSVAMMAELMRTRQSDFCAGSANVLEYDDISKGEAVWAPKLERLLRLWADGTVAKGTDAAFGRRSSSSSNGAETNADKSADDEAAQDSSAASPSAIVTTSETDPTQPTSGNESAETEWNGFDDDDNDETRANAKL